MHSRRSWSVTCLLSLIKPSGKSSMFTTPLPPGNFQPSDPPLPLGISESLRGGGMDIFWNYTFHTPQKLAKGCSAGWHLADATILFDTKTKTSIDHNDSPNLTCIFCILSVLTSTHFSHLFTVVVLLSLAE